MRRGTRTRTTYGRHVGDQSAHQLPTLTLTAALVAYARALQQRWPIPTTRAAWRIGGIWTSATVAFEFLFGHYVAGESWASLAGNYDVRQGRLWAAVPRTMAALPAVVHGLDRKAGCA